MPTWHSGSTGLEPGVTTGPSPTGKGQGKNKGANNQGKGKNPVAICYRCRQPGHLAKDCRTAVYNLWYYPNKGYDANWYSSEQTGYYQYNGQQYQQPQQTPQPALTAPPSTTAQEQQSPARHLVAALDNKMSSTPMASTLQLVQQDENKVDIIIDSGAATDVCPPWFAPNTPMYSLEHGQGPQLRTATDENIPVYGYKWVRMTNVNKQQLVVPFFVCEVTQPNLSVTRLAEQGFNIQPQSIQKSCGQATMDDIHTTRHQLCDKGTSKILVTQPTTLDQQKLKHLLRHIKGTQHYRFYVRPAVRTMDTTPDLDVFVGSDWAGCAATRKSTSGFVIKFMGSTIHFGSRAQATISLSSAEAELYAITTGATESLNIRNILQEALNVKKVNIRIHTDSSSGKSMATRVGSSKKAKHMELKHLFIQQLVQHDLVRIIKINTANNTADIFTKYVATSTLFRHLNDAGLTTQHY